MANINDRVDQEGCCDEIAQVRDCRRAIVCRGNNFEPKCGSIAEDASRLLIKALLADNNDILLQ